LANSIEIESLHYIGCVQLVRLLKLVLQLVTKAWSLNCKPETTTNRMQEWVDKKWVDQKKKKKKNSPPIETKESDNVERHRLAILVRPAAMDRAKTRKTPGAH
jgi:hypothetical protein